jgi:hypothetical protein
MLETTGASDGARTHDLRRDRPPTCQATSAAVSNVDRRVAAKNKPKLEWPDWVRVVANSYSSLWLPSRKAESCAIEPCGWGYSDGSFARLADGQR